MVRWIAGVLSALALTAGSAPAQPFKAVEPAAAGWDPAALAGLLTYVQGQKTTGFLIVQDRRIVAERNWPLAADATTFRDNFTHGTSRDSALIEDVASAQKSFVAVLAAIASDKGKLDIDKPVAAYLGAGWSKAPPADEAKITVRQVMEMRTGLKEDLTIEAPAGSRFFYNTPVYAKMKPILEKASGQSLDAISKAWLTGPAGMADTSWALRPEAFREAGNPTGLATTPRDLAILGQLVLDKGLAQGGKRVVSEAQLAALFERTETNPAYGRLWWLNGSAWSIRPPSRRLGSALIPMAPAELVAALGAQDRKLYIVPSRKLLVVRMGQATPDRAFDDAVWRLVMAAAPK